jgi:hypothetical protein
MSINFPGRAGLLLISAACAAAAFVTATARPAAAQGRPTVDPALNRRMENERNIRDQQRLMRGMEIDAETRNLSKEERQERAAEDFMRLQVLHNELMELLGSGRANDEKPLAEKVADARTRAAHLRLDLVLPDPAKEEKQPKTDAAAGAAQPDASVAKLCELIRSFVANLNQSPNDKKAGALARRDLDRIVALADEFAARAGSPAKPTN